MTTKRTGKIADPAEVDKPTELPDPESEEVDVEEVSSADQEEEWDLNKQDPNEEVWEGGPTYGQAKAWKEQYGAVYIVSVTPERHIMWRPINRFEYRRMVKMLEQALATGMPQSEATMNNDEAIAELCALHPPYSRANPAGEMAGVASTLSNMIMEASGFSPVEVREL